MPAPERSHRGYVVPLAIALGVGVGVAKAAPPAAATHPVVAFLNEAITWYRQQLAQAQLATEPSDVVFADATRHQSRQVLSLAFDYARAEVALEPGAGRPAPDRSESTQDASALGQRAADAQAAVARAQATVAARERDVRRATSARRPVAQQLLAEAQSELQLATARRDALRTLTEFVARTGDPGSGASGVLGQIDELQRSVPELAAGQTGAETGSQREPAGATGAAARRAEPTGVIALASDVLSLARKLRQIRTAEELTRRLAVWVDKQRAPLLTALRATLQGAEQTASADEPRRPAAVQQRTAELDQATTRFKEVSAALVPLGKIAILLGAQQASLSEWHGAADDQYDVELRTLAFHLVGLALAIAAILAASSAWRTATFRYVRDPRRRRQSLLLRRVVVAFAVALVLLLSFVTELGSFATFAGFITAGLAVALQNVILSVAGYFFLIGKYGISVGDRVQIAGVTGDVIDIGLVRLHLMELRADGLPTGRVVVFSNAVLFQPTANFFKQIPGSSFAWHEVSLTISADSDYRYAERRLLEAVEPVYARYRDAVERQQQAIAHQLSPLPVHSAGPQTQLLLTEGGLHMTIRFPVPLDRAPAVDDEVTRALLDAIEREPRLKLVGSATPTIQAVPAAAPAPAPA